MSVCKKSKNSKLSAERPYDLILLSNFLFLPPVKNSNSNGFSSLPILDKISVHFFGHPFVQLPVQFQEKV